MTVTFVSAFMNLHDTPNAKNKSYEYRIQQFNKLNATGIRLHVFVSPEYRDDVTVTNGVVETLSIEDLDLYKISPQGVPDSRAEEKDTRNFLILMNSKVEFIRRAIESNCHTSSHYAWVDFNIYHVLRNPASALELKAMETCYLPPRCMYFPGNWARGVVFEHVNWRFCGGFFVGDRASLLDFYDLYVREYPYIAKLTWEVNVWAYLESKGWRVDWYKGDHDPTILHVPRNVVHVPDNLEYTWASPDCGLFVGGSMYQFVLNSIRPYALTAIFPKSDGVIGDDEYDRMIASLGREEQVVTPGRVYRMLEEHAHDGTRPIVCMHSSRDFRSPSLLLMPWSDIVFDRGLSFPQIRWEDKQPTVIWRGGSSGFYRPSIRMLVVQRLFGVPNTDVRFTRGGWPINDNIIPDQHFGDRMTTEEQMKYKFMLIIDGNTPASNGQWAFATGSVPILVTHPANRWWADTELQPMVNYVPIQYDLSDLVEKIEWLLTHDAEARIIAENALNMSKRVFSPSFQRGYISNRIQQIVQQGH